MMATLISVIPQNLIQPVLIAIRVKAKEQDATMPREAFKYVLDREAQRLHERSWRTIDSANTYSNNTTRKPALAPLIDSDTSTPTTDSNDNEIHYQRNAPHDLPDGHEVVE